MLLHHLPRSLLSSSLLLLTVAATFASAKAAPVAALDLELTPATFDKTVAKGLWFIEHYSPYCPHCKHFKPTWDKLDSDVQTEIPQVKLANINCVVNGDLCDKNGIKAYPTMWLFEDGKKIEEFKGARDLDLLKKFLKKHVKAEEEAPAKDSTTTTALDPVATSEPQHHAPPPQTHKDPTLNLNGEVLALTPDTFASVVSQGPAFIKFFAPWCGHCKKLAPTWKALARHLQNKVTVAEVNCDDHQALCKEHGVTGYPALLWFAQGTDPNGRSEFSGGRKIDQLRTFAEKAANAGVEVLASAEALDAQVKSQEVLYLLLHSPDSDDVLQTIRKASAPLLGSPPIYASSSKALWKRYAKPGSAQAPWALFALKDHDGEQPTSAFYGPVNSAADEGLRKWVLSNRIPTSLKLTRDTFQSVMNAPQKPLVVIAASSAGIEDRIEKRLKDVARKWRVRTLGTGHANGREVVWTWMDRARWADWLKSMYGIEKVGEGEEEKELEDVKVVIADHGKLVYYDTDAAGNSIRFTSSASLFQSVDDAASSRTTYKNSENLVERLARSINKKMEWVEEWVTESPLKAVFVIALVIVAVLVVLSRIIGNDTNAVRDWKDSKGKNGRLD